MSTEITVQLVGGMVAVLATALGVIRYYATRNGNGPLSKHAWEMRTQVCATHQTRQEELAKETIAAIREQTAELRHVLNRGFNIEDTQPGKRTR